MEVLHGHITFSRRLQIKWINCEDLSEQKNINFNNYSIPLHMWRLIYNKGLSWSLGKEVRTRSGERDECRLSSECSRLPRTIHVRRMSLTAPVTGITVKISACIGMKLCSAVGKRKTVSICENNYGTWINPYVFITNGNVWEA